MDWRFFSLTPAAYEPGPPGSFVNRASAEMQRHYDALALGEQAVAWEERRQKRLRATWAVRCRLADRFGIPTLWVRHGIEETTSRMAWLYRFWAWVGKRHAPQAD